MQTYTIAIDEDQRLHIIAALKAAKLSIDPSKDSLVYLLEMLKGMPEVEEDNPRGIHGLCL